MTLLKVVEGASAKEVEGFVNTWIKDSGEVHKVINMRVYPPSEHCDKWICYAVYLEKYENAA